MITRQDSAPLWWSLWVTRKYQDNRNQKEGGKTNYAYHKRLTNRI